LENLGFMTASPESCAGATGGAVVITANTVKIFARM
jgi:hypothetical protein